MLQTSGIMVAGEESWGNCPSLDFSLSKIFFQKYKIFTGNFEILIDDFSCLSENCNVLLPQLF